MLFRYITCTPRPGLRQPEVQVTVHDITARPQRLRVPRGFLLEQDGRSWLPIGVVARHHWESRGAQLLHPEGV